MKFYFQLTTESFNFSKNNFKLHTFEKEHNCENGENYKVFLNTVFELMISCTHNKTRKLDV